MLASLYRSKQPINCNSSLSHSDQSRVTAAAAAAAAVTCFGLLRLRCLLYHQKLLPFVERHNAVAIEIEFFKFGEIFLWFVRVGNIRVEC